MFQNLEKFADEYYQGNQDFSKVRLLASNYLNKTSNRNIQDKQLILSKAGKRIEQFGDLFFKK